MDKPIDIPANLYEDEVVCFMADRYRTTTESDAMFFSAGNRDSRA